jgi:hypothetical protein
MALFASEFNAQFIGRKKRYFHACEKATGEQTNKNNQPIAGAGRCIVLHI